MTDRAKERNNFEDFVFDCVALGTDHCNDKPAPQSVPEAIELLQALVSQAVTEARMDELRHIPNHTSINLYVRERIKQLNASQTQTKER